MRALTRSVLAATLPLLASCQLIAGFSSSSADTGPVDVSDGDAGDGDVVDAASNDADVTDGPAGDTAIDAPLEGGTPLWWRRLGRQGGVSALFAAADVSGNVVVTGTFRGTIDLGGAELTAVGHRDIFVASYAPDGTHRWSRRFGGDHNDHGRGVAVGDHAVAVTGTFANLVGFGGVPLSAATAGFVFTLAR